MEYAPTSKLLALPHSHIKEKLILKAYWANILHVCLTVGAHNNTMTSASSPKNLGETIPVPAQAHLCKHNSDCYLRGAPPPGLYTSSI